MEPTSCRGMHQSLKTCTWMMIGFAGTFACHPRISPSPPSFSGIGGLPTISMHCGRMVDTSAERAQRWQLTSWIGMSTTVAALAVLPMAATTSSRKTRFLEISGLSLTALSGWVFTRVARVRANHHQAIAVGYAACADLHDDMFAYPIASEFYRLAKHEPLHPADLADVLGRVLRQGASLDSVVPPEPPSSMPPSRPLHSPRRDSYEVSDKDTQGAL